MRTDNNDVVIIELDRPRELRFGHKALKTLMALTGKTMEEIDEGLDVSNFEFVEQLAYCGLIKDAERNGEKLTLEQIPDLLDEAPGFAYYTQKIIEAWYITFGVKPQDPEGNLPGPAMPPASENPSTGKKASE